MGVVGVIGGPTEGNLELVAGLRGFGIEAHLTDARTAVGSLGAGDTALLRLDVLPSLDGVEPGLEHVPDLVLRGVRVLNRPEALLVAHDKLETAARLSAARLPHPITAYLSEPRDVLALEPPVVLKPRFGSWGTDVWRCLDAAELQARAEELGTRSWFKRHGVLVQDLQPSPGYDLRVIVAGGRVVGAVRRFAAPGEWRTNTSVGGRVEPFAPPAEAVELALRGAAMAGSDLVGVDLLPLDGGFLVLELNGAVEFASTYSLAGRDIYADIAAALRLSPVAVT